MLGTLLPQNNPPRAKNKPKHIQMGSKNFEASEKRKQRNTALFSLGRTKYFIDDSLP